MNDKIPTTVRLGEDLVVPAIGIRAGRYGEEVVLDRSQPAGTLVRLGDRVMRLSRRTVARRRDRSRFGWVYVGAFTDVYAPIGMHVVATSVNLSAEPGDEILGDITGLDLPERLRVVRVVKRHLTVLEPGAVCAMSAAIYEAVPAAARFEAVAA